MLVRVLPARDDGRGRTDILAAATIGQTPVADSYPPCSMLYQPLASATDIARRTDGGNEATAISSSRSE